MEARIKHQTLAATLLTAVALIAVLGSVFFSRPGNELRDLDGVPHGALENGETDFTLLFFLGKSCPISTQYAPEIVRICDEYKSKGTACFLVYPEAGLSNAGLKQHLREFGHKSPAIIDTTHALVEKAGATVTPEAAVFSRSGSLLYRGRIDDLYESLGKPRLQVRQHDLRDALNTIVSGKPGPGPSSNAVGCFIEPRATGQQM